MIIKDDDEDFPIYRIMSIYEFYDLYVNKKLKLSLFSIQKDKNDGIEHFFSYLFFLGHFEKNNEALNLLQNLRQNKYMTCWSETKDSVAMWSLYSVNQEFIKVRTSIKKLSSELTKFSEKFSIDTQWERKDEKLVVLCGYIKKAKYLDLREYIHKIDKIYKQEYVKIITNFKDQINFRKTLDEDIELLNFFIKDISFQHEKEIRGELNVGISYADQFSSFEEWSKSAEAKSIPIKHNKNNELKTVEFIDISSPSFIEEISFDPRMPSYKRELLIDMMKIDRNMIVESNCFNPIITSDFKFDFLKGLI
ncbi:DUF2971 domain-containing protein [Rodentibacter pneumotropicus]|uniref:DUF2971 domain-containing protein n=3 Tax=Rodentibacter pneumotropicus TaxID=758 RepID=UPI0003614BF8|nr:DUF2971 domain-containing protein [Rodentibacter pneumotropicus]OOF61388.1 hypothetical protein BH925_10790 [Rodentibacter pneumotropicus]